METFIIRGGKKLHGEIDVRGAKNSVGNLMMATLLTKDPCVLQNVPDNKETAIAIELCEQIGSIIRWTAPGTLSVHTPVIRNNRVHGLSRKNRIPILALGPLLVRSGEAEVPLLGGDQIGPRPVDFHIGALEKLGAEIHVSDATYVARAAGLQGTALALPYPSVGATQNILLSSVLAHGTTVISNAAVEPEVKDLIHMLQDMGALIQYDTHRTITVEGVEALRGVTHTLIPDRLEAASFAVMTLATGGNVLVKKAVQAHLVPLLNAIRKIGGDYAIEAGGIRFFCKDMGLVGLHLETDTYPGFVTDWQQPFAVLLTQCVGSSSIHETVYEDRFGYIDDLKKMGARMDVAAKCLGNLPCRFQGKMYNHSCLIEGPTPLRPATIEMRDIRAGMAHIVAALVAEGESHISGVEHIDRGYENIDGRLRAIGADITRVS